MFFNKNGQALVEYLFLVTIVAISLITMLLLSQEVLVGLYNKITTAVANRG